jgi:hypothetical protein
MSIWKHLRNRIAGRAEHDLDREVHTHLDLEAEEQEESGLPPTEARYAARRAFGNTTEIPKTCVPPGAGHRSNDSRKTFATPFASFAKRPGSPPSPSSR